MIGMLIFLGMLGAVCSAVISCLACYTLDDDHRDKNELVILSTTAAIFTFLGILEVAAYIHSTRLCNKTVQLEEIRITIE
jgi:zinc transporter ZupT